MVGPTTDQPTDGRPVVIHPSQMLITDTTQLGLQQALAGAAARQNAIATIRKLAVLRRSYLEECTPGYYNNEGKPQERSEQDGFYGAGPIAFVKVLEDWRADGGMKGLVRH